MPHDTPGTDDAVITQRDDPGERVARAFTDHGWEVTAPEPSGWRRTARHPDHGRVIIARWAIGLCAQLLVELADGAWAIPAFAGPDEENRICKLIGISPCDLWSRDLFDEEAAAR